MSLQLILYPFNNKFIIKNEKLIGKGKSSIIKKFKMNDKNYIIKYFNTDNRNKNFKEFTYLNELFDNNLSYKCYGYNYKSIINNSLDSISIYDYIEGNNLKYYLTYNNFDLSIYNKIINNINYLHSKYILHNDLILENIMIDNEQNINIIDYGECYCYYKNQYISNYYINDNIINNMKSYMNNNIINYNNKKINYSDNIIFKNLNNACLDYIKHIKSIDLYNIFSSIILQYYLKDETIPIKKRIKKTRKLFYNVFSTINNNHSLNDKLFRYLINYKFTNRLNIPLYTFILYKYNKLNIKTLQQFNNIYNCIINNIDFIKILKDLEYNNEIDNINNINNLLNYIELKNKNKLTDINILILCIIHYSLSVYYRKIQPNIFLHFSYYFEGIINYINNLSDNIKILDIDKDDIELFLYQLLLNI